MIDYVKVGLHLQSLRKEKGLTQTELADILGVSNKTVSKWECGNALPELFVLKELADFYGITVDSILNASNDGLIVEDIKDNKMNVSSSEDNEEFDVQEDNTSNDGLIIENKKMDVGSSEDNEEFDLQEDNASNDYDIRLQAKILSKKLSKKKIISFYILASLLLLMQLVCFIIIAWSTVLLATLLGLGINAIIFVCFIILNCKYNFKGINITQYRFRKIAYNTIFYMLMFFVSLCLIMTIIYFARIGYLDYGGRNAFLDQSAKLFPVFVNIALIIVPLEYELCRRKYNNLSSDEIEKAEEIYEEYCIKHKEDIKIINQTEILDETDIKDKPAIIEERKYDGKKAYNINLISRLVGTVIIFGAYLYFLIRFIILKNISLIESCSIEIGIMFIITITMCFRNKMYDASKIKRIFYNIIRFMFYWCSTSAIISVFLVSRDCQNSWYNNEGYFGPIYVTAIVSFVVIGVIELLVLFLSNKIVLQNEQQEEIEDRESSNKESKLWILGYLYSLLPIIFEFVIFVFGIFNILGVKLIGEGIRIFACVVIPICVSCTVVILRNKKWINAFAVCGSVYGFYIVKAYTYCPFTLYFLIGSLVVVVLYMVPMLIYRFVTRNKEVIISEETIKANK